MEPEHAKWITSPSTCDRWTIDCRPLEDWDGEWEVTLTVYCDRRPKPIYVAVERVGASTPGYALHDYVSHLQLALHAERPRTASMLNSALMGQVKLPF